MSGQPPNSMPWQYRHIVLVSATTAELFRSSEATLMDHHSLRAESTRNPKVPLARLQNRWDHPTEMFAANAPELETRSLVAVPIM